MRVFIMLGLLLSLAGCGSDSTRDLSTNQVEESRVETHPTTDGGTVVTTKKTIRTKTAEQIHSEMDFTPPPAAMSALTGLASGGWAEILGGLGTAVFGGYGLIKHRENKKLKAKIPKPQVTTTV